MIAEFIDAVTGTTVYVNPSFVVSMRPDPEDPLGVTVVKLQDGETLRVRGDHREVADRVTDRLARAT
jgi:uncharacterized protein YlzI (FlbEa/FlbD family)